MNRKVTPRNAVSCAPHGQQGKAVEISQNTAGPVPEAVVTFLCCHVAILLPTAEKLLPPVRGYELARRNGPRSATIVHVIEMNTTFCSDINSRG